MAPVTADAPVRVPVNYTEDAVMIIMVTKKSVYLSKHARLWNVNYVYCIYFIFQITVPTQRHILYQVRTVPYLGSECGLFCNTKLRN